MNCGLSEKTIAIIQAVFQSHPEVVCVKLFGSRALGQYRPNSDIDLVLWGEIDEVLLGALHRELDELPLPYQFDLKVYSDISHAELREHIDQFAQDFYVSEKALRGQG